MATGENVNNRKTTNVISTQTQIEQIHHSGDRFTDIQLENQRLPASFGYITCKLLSLEDTMNELQDSLGEINRFVKLAKKYCTHPNDHNLTKDESAAIYIYAMEMSDDSNIYQILNQILRLEDRSKVRPWFGYLKLLDSATSKLPNFKGTVFRGIGKDVTKSFKKGQQIIWWSISSCSTSMNVISSFLNKSSSSTLFLIECSNGKSISSYTNYLNEDEVMLMPGTIFEVLADPLNHPSGFNMVHLKEINDDDEPPRPQNSNSYQSNRSTISAATVSKNPTIADQMLNRSQLKQKQIQTKQDKFQQFGITVAGGNGPGEELNQFFYPQGIFTGNDKSIYIADPHNDRVVKWKLNSKTGQIIAGGNGKGNENNQLNYPTDVLFDKKNNSFIISDRKNRRLIRCFHQNETNPQIINSNIICFGLTIDKNGFIYASNSENDEVRRWKQGNNEGELVAGGNGKGDHLNQLHDPRYIFIDEDYSLYISDSANNRVMKWTRGAKEGIIVAGGNGEGNSLKQLNCPQGVFVDHLGQIYVADGVNHRIMRWCEGNEEGEIVVGGNGQGNQSNQLNCPWGLSFDNEENLYVVDNANHRIQKYPKLLN
ncbi:unnamed protein product [Adineta steineri]|uniref:NAD(P)(+)--arginine ADP-ribosyltransferase n=1 Tax=Adineta steineri TaxID=433720 RepID=A0A815L9B9_9BILA|nr:unnamed protein product [Adineta steineri]CAF3911562.1 unnamed protein product [Adineta steineri]